MENFVQGIPLRCTTKIPSLFVSSATIQSWKYSSARLLAFSCSLWYASVNPTCFPIVNLCWGCTPSSCCLQHLHLFQNISFSFEIDRFSVSQHFTNVKHSIRLFLHLLCYITISFFSCCPVAAHLYARNTLPNYEHVLCDLSVCQINYNSARHTFMRQEVVRRFDHHLPRVRSIFYTFLIASPQLFRCVNFFEDLFGQRSKAREALVDTPVTCYSVCCVQLVLRDIHMYFLVVCKHVHIVSYALQLCQQQLFHIFLLFPLDKLPFFVLLFIH